MKSGCSLSRRPQSQPKWRQPHSQPILADIGLSLEATLGLRYDYSAHLLRLQCTLRVLRAPFTNYRGRRRVSSSVAEATDCTLVEASSEAAATIVVNSCDRTAVDVSVPAEASSSVDAEDTVSMISPTAPSKSSASLIMSALRCSALRFSVTCWSARVRSTSSLFFCRPAHRGVRCRAPQPSSRYERRLP
jgi:hypothetical protein